MRLGEALGMHIGEFVMGRGGTPYVEVVPRENNPNDARVKMLRPRRIYVGGDLERLYADYLTYLACRATDFGIPITPDEPLFRNLDRPPLLSALREGTVRDKVRALKRKHIGPVGWTPHWLRHTHATALLLGGVPEWVVSRRLGHAHVQTTLDLYGWVSDDEACGRQRIGSGSPRAGRSPPMPGDVLHPVSPTSGPVSRLLGDLPAAWRRDHIGADIDDWDARTEFGRSNVLLVGALPVRLRIELAWMAHWQYVDGNKVAVNMFNKAAETLRWALTSTRRTLVSLLEVDQASFTRLYQTWFESRYGRLPTRDSVLEFQRVVCGYPRLALLARSSEQPWWRLDTWAPRSDPRIPLRDREPHADQACRPGRLQVPWLREAVKWHLGTVLEAGILSWTTIGHDRLCGLLLLDRWLAALPNPAALTGDIAEAGALAAAFRRWLSDPRNRDARRRPIGKKVGKRQLNNGIRAVAELMAFVVENRAECRTVVGPSPWAAITEAHPAVWGKQIHRLGSVPPPLNDENYVDEHALAQITACLPVLGADHTETVTVTVNGDERQLSGRGHPQIMRMLLLQILTGRRASEICLCEFDCISPVSAHTIVAADGEQIARFRYAQSKIEQAPDTILVGAEVVAVIEEQQNWIRERFPGLNPKYLFLSQRANTHGTKFITVPTYQAVLQRFSELVQITDSKGRAVRLSRTHRFRHTRLTRLAELGLPVHVLQRYAGHCSPEMAMRYIAHREEHAEQAFLASRKFTADGTVVTFSREDHDGMHLFDRADRFLPNGYCLLPPLQTCDKGNACLTCSVFVTDTSHLDTLRRQLDQTQALIERTTTQFQNRHGTPMPADNPWLVQRTAEKDALTKILAAMSAAPGRACQGAGSPGQVPITLDTTSYRNREDRDQQPPPAH